MAVTAEAFAELMALAEATAPPETDDLRALQSVEQLIAYYYASTLRETQDSEAALDWTEMLVRALAIPPGEVRGYERTLRALGFVTLADRLRWLAGRRKSSLRPLEAQRKAVADFLNGGQWKLIKEFHQALGYQTPMTVWRDAMAKANAVDMMDNADALTCVYRKPYPS
jgi:hypothetical protein